MVVDTDAHQGNGYARDKLHFEDNDVFVLDVYNAGASTKHGSILRLLSIN
jgi:acetoin utilization deacetylase AcuC-like enzyme